MEPLFPTHNVEILEDLSVDLVAKSSNLTGPLHPITASTIAELVLLMNSFYSNLIEGHNTNPIDIEKALNQVYSNNKKQKALQLLTVAHINVEKEMKQKLQAKPNINISSAEFLKEIHAQFYTHLPDEFLTVENIHSDKITKVQPGKFRKEEVQIGQHIAPTFSSIPEFMNRFASFYNYENKSRIHRIIMAAASHHRFNWIHPFLDGNGRVARLYTEAALLKSEINSMGLWSISRAFARTQKVYMDKLQDADTQRTGDLDGRGNLSDRKLSEFCKYFLELAIDQIEFMKKLFEIDTMTERILNYAKVQSSTNKLKPESGFILRDVFLRGQVPRGDIKRIINKPESTARVVLSDLIKRNLLKSDTPKSAVKINFPVSEVAYFFPELFPPNFAVSQNSTA